MKKKSIVALFILIIPMILTAFPISAAEPSVAVSSQNVSLNGSPCNLVQYNIDGYNYVKLRDLAMVLNGTAKQFSVGWDSAINTATITSDSPYVSDGTESTKLSSDNLQPILSKDKVMINGTMMNLTAYKIDGRNYFKLKELATALDVGCEYVTATNTVALTTTDKTIDIENYEPKLIITKDRDGVIHESMDYVFVLDKDAVGEWKTVDLIETIDEFDPTVPSYTLPQENWYLGNSIYADGTMTKHRLVAGQYKEDDTGILWTKGYLYGAMNELDVIPAYEIQQIDGKMYMFMEWKSGDYTDRGENPWYYVFEKTSDIPVKK